MKRDTYRDTTVEVLHTQHGISKQLAIDIFNTVFQVLRNYILSGKSAEINGFGRFKVLKRKERKIRNFLTGGADILIPASYYVKFISGTKYKGVVNEEFKKKEDLGE
jgi:nucleoid DNA-binding protein